jgi:hypothetical protein
MDSLTLFGYLFKNNLRPVRGRKRVSPIQAVYVPLKQLTPRQGTKTPWWIPFKLLYETKHTLNNITEEDIKESMGIKCVYLSDDLTQEKTPYCALRVMPL